MNENTAAEMPVWVAILIPFACFLVFPLFWCSVVGILAHVGGWRRLARRYATDREPEGTASYGVYGRIGWVSYNGAVSCFTNEEGLFLEPTLLFRFAHPRLFLPWSEFRNVRRRRVLWLTMVRARIGDPKAGTLALEARVFRDSEGGKLLEN